ncbi:3-deoxy-7-phosphoheptulonate synthase [Paraburkholderia megapolitana]|uniref:Phospho-2-dehydro-3-deoxyheptonate aldolase n=1 Tax=Paraburkholderia megapolitana TaxID=420953 RepID=A0A1I3EUX8_9BURK|nr:3-deoxy-7-phosphoheptulonate synthase [Paraburkholderia megapolitana]QDQ80294.1 3-deoxy-7-phosphoheptulonate synthase [Paraburkholderia megapolitana]SFI02723.1 3-deoxy-D-arabinoheptulosonate-7-phosphate synthase [Paraburkholderia megapolitana]
MSSMVINAGKTESVGIIKPAKLLQQLPAGPRSRQCVLDSRVAVNRTLRGGRDKLLVIVGPCSIHDPQSALEYAGRLVRERERLGTELEIVMRVYFEKPRTTVGWKGLINDPFLDGSFEIEHGLHLARELLLAITSMGLPVATEFLDLATPLYLADLVSWGAIGARTTESQVHRELASSLPCAIGFKNGTEGCVQVAIDAIRAARHPHCYLGVDGQGELRKLASTGNRDGHLVLRGGKVPNYEAEYVDEACRALAAAGLNESVVIDASHGNSRKCHGNQRCVCESVAERVARGEQRISGVMIESHLVEGRQDVGTNMSLVYGQSITDSCLGWDDTVSCLNTLADSIRCRRVARQSTVLSFALPA